MKKFLECLLGRRIPQRLIEEVKIKGEHRSLLYRYEQWGNSIAKRPIWRELVGREPSAFYNLDGKLVCDNYNLRKKSDKR